MGSALYLRVLQGIKTFALVHEYYAILGLVPGATPDEIKRAYRKLALTYHPDVNKEPGAKERFLRITEAYNYLSNPPKRSAPNIASQRKAEEERIKRAKAAATQAARLRYEAFKRRQERAQGRAYSNAIRVLLGIVFLSGGIYFANKYFNTWYVNQDYIEVEAFVMKVGVRHFWLQYEVDGVAYVKKFSGLRSKRFLVADNGMPVMKYEMFMLRYRRGNPLRAYIDFSRVLPRTFTIYQQILSTEMARKYEISSGDPRLECLMLLVYEQYGLPGLADLFFWQESPLENFNHNSWSYARMAKEPAFQKIESNCLLMD